MRRPSRSTLVALAAAALTLVFVPSRIASWQADAYFRGDVAVQRSLGKSAAEWLQRDPQTLSFHTGSPRFDGEWFLIIHMAAALGFVQTALEHPELSPEHLEHATRAVERLLTPLGREHDREAWNEDALATFDGPHGHLAFLSYANLALSMHRTLAPDSPFRAQNDAITEALARRFATSPNALLESYPRETYPADNAVALASILVFDRVTGADHRAQTSRALHAMNTTAIEATSGLLFQRVHSVTGAPLDAARASGTAMAAFALGYASNDLARPLWNALAAHSVSHLGFGGVREYPSDRYGSADVDSGPLIFGLSVAASGFAVASARRFGDRHRHRALFASAWLFGLPTRRDDAQHFAAGGPLGDVLLFALLTAHRVP